METVLWWAAIGVLRVWGFLEWMTALGVRTVRCWVILAHPTENRALCYVLGMTVEQPEFRRWFQFRLRTLLIGVVVLSVLLSWFAARMEKARRQRAAVEAIQGMGGVVYYEWPIVPPGAAPKPPPSTWLRTVLGNDFFDRVKRVDLFLLSRAVTDADLEHLEALTDLRCLVLFGPEVTDAGLVHLESLTDLEELYLMCSKTTDAGLEHVKGLTRLKTLGLQSTQVSDAGLKHLQGLTNLEVLGLRHTWVTDAGLEQLKGLTHLESLVLSHTRVTDAGLEHLAGLASLRSLTLDETAISDAGLAYLGTFTHLEILKVSDTEVTPEGVEKLQGVLPDCWIEY